MDLKLLKQRRERRILARVTRLKIGRKAKLIVKKEGASELQPTPTITVPPVQEDAVTQVVSNDGVVEESGTLTRNRKRKGLSDEDKKQNAAAAKQRKESMKRTKKALSSLK